MIKIDENFIKTFSCNEQLVMLRLLLQADDEGITEIVSRKFAEQCGLTRQQLRTILVKLSSRKEIEVMVTQKENQDINPKGNPKNTLVCICNYDTYRFGKKKNTQNATHNAITLLQEKCKKRAEIFEKSLIPFVISRGGIYEPVMIRSFFNYWTERNKLGTKMRFEMEKTWETDKRLVTWSNKNNKYEKRASNNKESSADKRASRKSLEDLADRILE